MLTKIKESFDFRLNFQYSVAQAIYWMLYCTTLSLASAFLLGRGFSTAHVGFLLAMVFLFATLIQQLISTYADNSKQVTVLDILMIISVVLIISMAFVIKCKTTGTGFWFFIACTSVQTMMPLLNALNFSLEKTGVKLNFGFSRAMGSLFFFFISLIAGNMMNSISPNACPAIAFILSCLYLANFAWIKYDTRDFDINNSKDFDPFDHEKEDSVFSVSGIKEFYSKYKMFFIFLLGVVGFFFGHVVLNNFFYQVVVNVGGDTADNGGIIALQAIVELPCMIFFLQLKDRFSTKFLLGTSAVFFTVKLFLATIATSVGMLYFSVIFQGLSFALFIPGSVQLVHEIMDEKDAVKGQAFVTMAMTISNFLAAIFGGLIINFAGVTPALFIGTIITLAGTILAIFGLFRIN